MIKWTLDYTLKQVESEIEGMKSYVYEIPFSPKLRDTAHKHRIPARYEFVDGKLVMHIPGNEIWLKKLQEAIEYENK